MEAYLKKLHNTVSVFTYCGGNLDRALKLGNQMALERDMDVATLTIAQIHVLQYEAQGRYLAVAFLMGAYKQQFGLDWLFDFLSLIANPFV